MTDLKVAGQYAARLLMLSFFLPMKWQVGVVMCISVWFIVRSFQRIGEARKTDFGWALFFGSLFVIYFAALLITPAEYQKILLHICERRVSLFFTPLVMALAGPHYRKVILGELNYFVYGCFISCMAANVDFLYHYFIFNGGMHNASHVAYRILFERFTGIHPTYMGMFLVFSACITMLSRDYGFRNGDKLRYALFFMLLLFLLALLAKSALIALIIIFLHYGWVERKWVYKHKLRLASLAAALAVACFLIPFTGQRMREVFSFIGHSSPANITNNSVYVRKAIVDIDLGLLRHNWLTGVGPGRVLHSLQERWFFYSLVHNTDVGSYDPHNEYLNEWLGFGITGVILLAAMLLVHLYRAIKGKDRLYLYCLVVLITAFFTETALSRQEGVLFYALFTSLFFFNSGIQSEPS